MNYIATRVKNTMLYEKNIAGNSYLACEFLQKYPLKSEKNARIGAEFNNFLNSLPEDATDWIVFCPEFLEFLENPIHLLANADPRCLYGVLGVNAVKNLRGKNFREHVGKITHYTADGREYTLGMDFPLDAEVETLVCDCLVVHSSVIREHGLRFDPNLSDSLFVEDFCLTAKKSHGIASKVLHCACRLHGSLEGSLTSHPDSLDDYTYFVQKHEGKKCLANASGADTLLLSEPANPPKQGIYQRIIEPKNYNIPAVLASQFMHPKTRVLDVGCAYGDIGVFFQKKLQSILWGMEYDKTSLQVAAQKGVYQELAQVDLEQFFPADFRRFYKFFEHIFMGDVLEHVRSPLDVLRKCALFLDDKGSFIVSLPNVAHSFVLSNLLTGNFEYDDCGILDATHLRFFTAKSQARLFAKAGLMVKNATATFMGPDEFLRWTTPKRLPHSLYSLFESNKHFFVVQYVCELSLENRKEGVLFRDNYKMLQQAPENNPLGWASKAPMVQDFSRQLNFLNKGDLSAKKIGRIQFFLEKDQKFEAVEESGLFDAHWYLAENPDVKESGMNPLQHYLNYGWTEGRAPSEYFDTGYYLEQKSNATNQNICPLLHYLQFGRHDGTRRVCSKDYEQQSVAEFALSLLEQAEDRQQFVEFSQEGIQHQEGDARVLAFYLPQFYPNAANDCWWGKGFTEWTNVSKALPQYTGHYQPHLPFDVGFYDLRLTEVVSRQIELARQYGVHGFCYYYYWFNGRKMLDMPVYRLLEHPELDFPFCIAWANEPWSALWDGGRKELLVDQNPLIDAARLFKDILPLLQDKRYIRVDGKPVLVIYRPKFHEQKHFFAVMQEMRHMAEDHGLSGLHIVFVKHQGGLVLDDYGGDAFVEFPPHGVHKEEFAGKRVANTHFKGVIYDQRAAVEAYKKNPTPEELTYRGVFPMWDNSPRKAHSGCMIFENSSPELYEEWLTHAIMCTKQQNPAANNLVFVNAWNEWGEGAHLEPDRKFGYAYLEATKRALLHTR